MAVSITNPRHSNRLRPSARDSARYRRNPIESGTAERNRLRELLKTANVKLASVVTDVFQVYGPLVLEALVVGAVTPQEMAQRRQREKVPGPGPALEEKLEGHHRFLLKLQLASGTFRLHRGAGAESRMAQ